MKKSPSGSIVPGRVVRRAKRQISGISTGSDGEYSETSSANDFFKSTARDFTVKNNSLINF